MKRFFGPTARAPAHDPDGADTLSRRRFITRALAASGALVALPAVLEQAGLRDDAAAATPDLVTDTFNGLVAFVVPGGDDYSVAQGESTAEPGGIEGYVTPALIQGLNFASPPPPDLAGSVATLLNAGAQIVNLAAAAGAFASPFANLSFAEKAATLSVLESAEPFAQLRSLFGVLPSLVASPRLLGAHGVQPHDADPRRNPARLAAVVVRRRRRGTRRARRLLREPADGRCVKGRGAGRVPPAGERDPPAGGLRGPDHGPREAAAPVLVRPHLPQAGAVRRLFVADNAALPNSLGGANPTLTTQALATRTAERIVSRRFDGKPWVRKQAPTSSIDPAVTLAVVARGEVLQA
jgi:hypothetical protein